MLPLRAARTSASSPRTSASSLALPGRAKREAAGEVLVEFVVGGGLAGEDAELLEGLGHQHFAAADAGGSRQAGVVEESRFGGIVDHLEGDGLLGEHARIHR